MNGLDSIAHFSKVTQKYYCTHALSIGNASALRASRGVHNRFITIGVSNCLAIMNQEKLKLDCSQISGTK